MIWQLMKRDAAWRWAPAAALIFAYLRLPVVHSGRWEVAGMLPLVMAMGVAAPSFMINGTPFEGTLPIPGRALWLSRVISVLAMCWMPVLAGSAVTFFTGGNASQLIEAGAAFTVVILLVKCIRVRELSGPRWLKMVPFAAGMGALAALGPLDPVDRPSPGIVLAACGLASGGLFLWGWSTVPKSFEIAPPGTGVPARPRATRAPSRFVWAPVWRSIFGWQMWFSLFLAFEFLSIGGLYSVWYLGAVILLNGGRVRNRWLLPLPVSARKLFRMIMAPLAVAMVAASGLRIFLDTDHPLTPRMRVASLAGELTFFCFLMFLCGLVEWRRLGGIRLGIRAIPMALGIAIIPVAGLVTRSRGSTWIFDEALRRMAAALPENGWLLAPALAIPVIASYALAEKIFAESER